MQQLIGAMSTTSSSSSAAIPTVPLSSSTTLVAPLVMISTGRPLKPLSQKVWTSAKSMERIRNFIHAFDDLQRLLNQEHLLTLVNGSRKEPEATISNKYGFTQDQVVTIDGETCCIPSDDIGLHHYDRSQALPLLRKFIGPDLRWQFRAVLDSQKCTRVHAALVAYIKGRSAKDVTIAQKHINE